MPSKNEEHNRLKLRSWEQEIHTYIQWKHDVLVCVIVWQIFILPIPSAMRRI